jgi:hypothetical protein
MEVYYGYTNERIKNTDKNSLTGFLKSGGFG